MTVRALAAILAVTLVACSTSTGAVRPSSPASSASAPSVAAPAPPGCPTGTHAIESLLGEPIADADGPANGSTEQICAFTTSATDVGALSVVYLRFPRPELEVRSLAGARRLYGSPMTGHTIIAMPSWGADAFLDESILPKQNLIAEFAWVPGFEIILGMHTGDRHAAERRQLIDRLVAFTH